jgi:glycine dehydrogenase
MSPDYIKRHIPHSEKDDEILKKTLKTNSLTSIINEIIPTNIHRKTKLDIESAESEYDFLMHINTIAKKNKAYISHIGLGYYNSITPSVILRNLFENPGWYTQYTPYQAEIAQGRLEALINFQTMVTELTGLPIANASLLDEATAAAEAMIMCYRQQRNTKKTCLIASDSFPQTIQVVNTRAHHLGINTSITDLNTLNEFNEDVFAIIIQSPNRFGEDIDYKSHIELAKQNNIDVIFATDLAYLTHQNPPQNIDVAIGSTQRFGIPLGNGGPHAAFFATTEKNSRKIPGRIIGVTTDKQENKALRMALQTREQHIRKEKATSNICTSQALLAIMAGMYAVFHGPKSLQQINNKIHNLANSLAQNLKKHHINILTDSFFDTITLTNLDQEKFNSITSRAKGKNRFFNTTVKNTISISFDETHSLADVEDILNIIIGSPTSVKLDPINKKHSIRDLNFMSQHVFNSYHSETQLMRYLKQLENKDLSLTTSMIPLGSCTMKLNAASAMIPLSNPLFANCHPYAPKELHSGYEEIINKLGKWLCNITELDAVSFQPNSGAQGEYAGLLAIKNYFNKINQSHRNIALVPTSAHGTNPASAFMAGLKIIPIKCDTQGNIDMNDLNSKVTTYKDTLALLMVTYPSTHGVFEDTIKEICELIHENGGQVYLDGANLNAQVGLTSPGIIGADVCHINLHKTFSIPHGGGGPGMGPICVKKHLEDYLPKFSLDFTNFTHSVSAAEYSSASILLISYAYIHMMGGDGLTKASTYAILHANYIKEKLEPYYPILFTGSTNKVAHELIIDCKSFKKEANITVEDIAKRLIDYSFHAPTLSWPVADTLMIEPTESESIEECDRFCDAMIEIYNEIQEIISNKADKQDNVLKNAPHTQKECISSSWNHVYSREKACYPLDYLKQNKFWPSISRVNQAKGDRELICTCDILNIYDEKVEFSAQNN